MSNIDDIINAKVKKMKPSEFAETASKNLTSNMKRRKFINRIKKGAENLGIYYDNSSGVNSFSSSSLPGSQSHIHRPRESTSSDKGFNPSDEAIRRAAYDAYYKMVDGKGYHDCDHEH